MVSAFERQCLEKHLVQEQWLERDTVSKLLFNAHDRLDSVISELEEIKENLGRKPENSSVMMEQMINRFET